MVTAATESRARGGSGAVSGTLIVVLLLVIVAATAGGLIWYKHQPQVLPPALNDATGVMLLIPAGPFVHGSDKQQGVAPAFYMDRVEVSNRLYANFCTATRHELPPGGLPPDRPEDPVVNITIEDAASFAKWAGKRLPDALEWEKAYGGAEGHLFPWGDTRDPSLANVSDDPSGPHRPMPVDSMQAVKSPYNLLHMAGNVAEYVRTSDRPGPNDVARWSRLLGDVVAREPWYQIKGSSYMQLLEAALPWKSEVVPLRFRAAYVGFRCAKDPPRR